MDEDQRLQLLGLFPEGVELGRGDFFALDAAADGGANQAQAVHAVLELLGGELRKLQRHRRVAQKAAGNRLAHLRELFTLDVEHPAREVAVRRVPERVDAEHLHVDAVLVHVRDPRSLNRKAEVPLELSAGRCLKWRTFDDVEHGRHGAVRVHVHGLDSTAAYCDLAPPWGAGRLSCRMSDAATDADDAGRCGRRVFQKSSSIEHGILPNKFRPSARVSSSWSDPAP